MLCQLRVHGIHVLCLILLSALGGHEDVVQSFSWHGNGSMLATICKVLMS